MSQTLTPSKKSLTTEDSHRITCLYTNLTNRIQVIKLTTLPNSHLERVIFPRQRLIFEATPEAELEVQTAETLTLLIPCEQLRITETIPEI